MFLAIRLVRSEVVSISLSLTLLLACSGRDTVGSAADSTDTGLRGTIDVEVEASEPVVCADSSLRELQPLEEVLVDTWMDQAVIGDGSPPTTKGPRPATGVAVADLDGDGALDIFLPNNGGPDQLYLGDGAGNFVDETADRWPGNPRDKVTSASAVDVDGDADIDLYLTVARAQDQLFLNDGSGSFDAGQAVSALTINSVNSTWADVDRDGDLDAYISGHLGSEPMDPPVEGLPLSAADLNQFLVNNGDGTFSDATEALPEAAHVGYATLSGFHDVDADGWPELYVVNDYGLFQPNVLLKNDGGSFTDVSAETGAGISVLGMGLGMADINDDDRLDMLVSSWGELVMLESLADETWYQSQRSRGLVPSGDSVVAWGVELVDMDNDGDQDAVVAYGSNMLIDPATEGLSNPDLQPDQLFVQQPDGSFSDEAPAWGVDDDGIGRGFVVADLDGDGWLDLVKRDLSGHTQLYLANCGDEAWLEVTLSQPGPNPFAVGARVYVEAEGLTWRDDLNISGTSMGSSPPPVAHFGLGALDEVTLRIVWPDGELSETRGVGTRRRVRVVR